jgi:hypothetical protein
MDQPGGLKMACIEILEAALREPKDGRLRGCYIDLPRAGRREYGDELEVHGWALGRDGPALAVELLESGRLVRRVPVDQPRPDLVPAFPDVPWAGQGGWHTRIRVRVMGEFEWEVRAVLPGRARVPIGTILGRRRWRENRDGARGTALVSAVITGPRLTHFPTAAVERLCVQTYPHLEVVVVTDDPAAGAAAEYPWVRWERPEGEGLAAARNTGIRVTNGNYLVFLAPGDRLMSDALATGLEQLRSHPGAAFVAGRRQGAGSDGAEPTLGNDPYATLLRGHPGPPSAAVLYCREVFETVTGFAPMADALVDYELYLRVARQFPVIDHQQPMLLPGEDDRLAFADPEALLGSALAVLREQRKFVRGSAERRRAWRQGRRAWRDRIGSPLAAQARAHLAAGEWKQAARAVQVLLRCHPRGLAAVLSARGM